MAGVGRRVRFHGAFKSKERAQAKERKVAGAYIEEHTIKGHRRFVVISRR